MGGPGARVLKRHSLLPLARYLLYDVNPPEGFNLRRDVYIRVASLLKTLLKTEEWVLVLPPWGRLYHWRSPDIHQVRIPWSDFFDLPSLNRNIPVIEYEQFIAGEQWSLSWGLVADASAVNLRPGPRPQPAPPAVLGPVMVLQYVGWPSSFHSFSREIHLKCMSYVPPRL